jgi:outer membrane receptor protein involved in Fe transport
MAIRRVLFRMSALLLVSPFAAIAAAPSTELERIVVTATRVPMTLGDVPSVITVFDREEIERSPTKTLDELLRGAPSFGLFRRSSSVAADPSSQGVRLRNVAASGISRALVLVDGIPANDSFGGWVAWRSIPRIGIESVEVAPGGGSAIYGNYALGGVIQTLSRPIEGNSVDLDLQYGSFDTTMVAARVAGRRDGLGGGSLEGEYFDSDGYPVVAEDSRGSIDGDTPSRHSTVRGRLEFDPAEAWHVQLAAGWFDESLQAGTQYTTADMERAEYSARATYASPAAGTFGFTIYGHDGEFRQDRARVAPDRNSETQSAHQDVPSEDAGASILWNAPQLQWFGAHEITLGSDLRAIEGTTREDLFPTAASLPGNPTVARDAGGRQRLAGVFVEDAYRHSDTLGAVLAVRYDHWQNTDGWRDETAYDGTVLPTRFEDRSGDEVSPKLGVHWKLRDGVSARASAYRSFRAPTLDELYRPFQVGTIRTDSNPDLVPETLTGAEAGIDLGGDEGKLLRFTLFRNDLHDPIVNVSTGSNTRQRQNLGVARIEGFELESAWAFAPGWQADLAATLADTEVTSAPGQPQLVGNELPQAPRLQGRIALTYDHASLWNASLAVRYVGEQFENDLNTLPMGDAWLTDVAASWQATPRIEAYVAVENLFDETYLVGRAGVDTVGQPRFIHGGFRVSLRGPP